MTNDPVCAIVLAVAAIILIPLMILLLLELWKRR